MSTKKQAILSYTKTCQKVYKCICDAYIDLLVLDCISKSETSYSGNQLFICQHLVDSIKNDLALSICKILCDKDKRSHTLVVLTKKAKELIKHDLIPSQDFDFSTSEEIEAILKKLEKFRNKIIAHNDFTNCEIEIVDLKKVLEFERNSYNSFCYEEIDDNIKMITENTISRIHLDICGLFANGFFHSK